MPQFTYTPIDWTLTLNPEAVAGSAPSVTGLRPGLYRLRDSSVGYVSPGSLGDCVMVWRSLSGFLRGSSFSKVVTCDQVLPDPLALEHFQQVTGDLPDPEAFYYTSTLRDTSTSVSLSRPARLRWWVRKDGHIHTGHRPLL